MAEQDDAVRRALARPIGQPKGDALAERLREYHERGVAISELQADYSEKDLRELFSVSQDQLYKTLAFARYYDPEELEVLCATRNSDGNPLRWAHVRELLVYRDDKKARLKMQSKAVTEGWTVDELHEQIRQDRRGSLPRTRTVPGRRFKFDTVGELARRSAEIERQLASLLVCDDESDESTRRIDRLLAGGGTADQAALDDIAQRLAAIMRHASTLKAVVQPRRPTPTKKKPARKKAGRRKPARAKSRNRQRQT